MANDKLQGGSGEMSTRLSCVDQQLVERVNRYFPRSPAHTAAYESALTNFFVELSFAQPPLDFNSALQCMPLFSKMAERRLMNELLGTLEARMFASKQNEPVIAQEFDEKITLLLNRYKPVLGAFIERNPELGRLCRKTSRAFDSQDACQLDILIAYYTRQTPAPL